MTDKRPILRVPQIMVDRIKEVINEHYDEHGTYLNQIQAMEIIATQSKIKMK